MKRTHDKKPSQSVTSAKPTTLNLQTRPFAPLQTDSSEDHQITDSASTETKDTSSKNILQRLISTPTPESAAPIQRKPHKHLKSSRMAIQAKLSIGKPNDKYEQEADATAAKVVQQINAPQNQSVQRQGEMQEEDELQMKPISTIQREESMEEDELQMKPLVQRRENIGGGEASTDLESSIQRARGGGQSLDAGLQTKMGQAMGADFSGVKVHTDSQSDQLNKSIQAKAFTTGQDVFFRQGAYEPGSRGGQELIAHELTHVVQQDQGRMVTESLVQRTLAYNQPIDDLADIATVTSLAAGKLVFELSGPSGTVIVKIETGSTTEGKEEGMARWSHGSYLAKEILANVPGATLLTPEDRKVLGRLPDALGQDAKTLREALDYYDSLKGSANFVVKLEKADMGKNLLERIEESKISGDTTELENVLHSQDVWGEMGKMAVFDLLIGNEDRFKHDGTCNFENIDFTAGANPSLKALDNFNPSVNSRLSKSTAWNGEKVLQGGRKDYAKKVTTFICNHASMKKGIVMWEHLFYNGMVEACGEINQLRQNFKLKIINNFILGTVERTTADVLLARMKKVRK